MSYNPQPGDQLTAREAQLVRLMVKGLINKQAAYEMGISMQTVKTCLQHIHIKAGVTTRGGLVAWAIRHGVE